MSHWALSVGSYCIPECVYYDGQGAQGFIATCRFILFSLVNIIMASGHKSGLTSVNGVNGQENWWVRVICGQKYVFYLEILFGGICIDMN